MKMRSSLHRSIRYTQLARAKLRATIDEGGHTTPELVKLRVKHDAIDSAYKKLMSVR